MTSDSVSYAIATSAEQLAQVYTLRYACYRRKASIEERADGQFSDTFDEKPNSFSFLASIEHRALATVRVSVVRPDLGWTESPVQHVYGDHPAFRSIARTSFVESSRLCFQEQARRDTFLALVGHMAALAEFYEVEWLVACPRIEHSPIYQGMFSFQPLAAPRRYFGVSFETQLLGIPVADLRHHVRNRKSMAAAWSAALAHLELSLPGRTLRAS